MLTDMKNIKQIIIALLLMLVFYLFTVGFVKSL